MDDEPAVVPSAPRKVQEDDDAEERGGNEQDGTKRPLISWLQFLTLLSALGCTWERRRQRLLTDLPLVFRQMTAKNDALCSLMTPVLMRTIRPSLFIGTRGLLNSIVGFTKPGPRAKSRFREIITMGHDGGRIGLDWELPSFETFHKAMRGKVRQRPTERDVLNGPILVPVVLILHGMNSDTTFGYIRSVMRACTDNGWVAVGMNMRGCGGVRLFTPRVSTISFTNDIRATVQIIATRMSDGIPFFLVGYSVGANLIVKYLGEDALANTLPSCVAGAVAVSNPLNIYDKELKTPWNHILALGTKRKSRDCQNETRQIHDQSFQSSSTKALTALSLAEMSPFAVPHLLRNESSAPFSTFVGYETPDDLWEEGSSWKYLQHISVPLLTISARDDVLVQKNTSEKLYHTLRNPNIIVLKTKSGGHLGFHVASWNNPFGSLNFGSVSSSWTDTVTSKFIGALIHMKYHGESTSQQCQPSAKIKEKKNCEKTKVVSTLRSRL